MANTYNRMPFSVSTKQKDYSNDGYFNQIEFKGICNNVNEVGVDALTFSVIENAYVNEEGVLASRPPVKFLDNDKFIIDDFVFGKYKLRLYRYLMETYDGGFWPYLLAPVSWQTGDAWPTGTDIYNRQYGRPPRGWHVGDAWPYEIPPASGTDFIVNNLKDFNFSINRMFFKYVIKCTSHNTTDTVINNKSVYRELSWTYALDTYTWKDMPKYKCAQVDDKIFIWFDDTFNCLNTKGIDNCLYFEDAREYLYLPITKLVTNGTEIDLETENFLTESYRKRYQYSLLSSMNFNKFLDKKLSVSLNGDMTSNTSKFLYDIICQNNQDRVLIYPRNKIEGNSIVDSVKTSRSTVMLMYENNRIKISFNARSFRALPMLDNIIGTPLLSRDGLCVIAFTSSALAKCKIVAQNSDDFLDTFEYTWTTEPYMKLGLYGGISCGITSISDNIIPRGYFETEDNFAYVIRVTGNLANMTLCDYLYTEWLSANDKSLASYELLDIQGTPILLENDAKLNFKYIPQTLEYPMQGPLVTIMSDELQATDGSAYSGAINFFHKQNKVDSDYVLKSGNMIYLSNNVTGYVYNCTADKKDFYAEAPIGANDCISLTPMPLTDIPTYAAGTAYTVDSVVASDSSYSGKLYICLQNCTNIDLTNTTYWKPLTIFVSDNDSVVNYFGPADEYGYSHIRKEPNFNLCLISLNVHGVPAYIRNGVQYYWEHTSWKLFYGLNLFNLCPYVETSINYYLSRFIIKHEDNSDGYIYQSDKVLMFNYTDVINYTTDELQNIFGNMPAGYDIDGNIDTAYTGDWVEAKSVNALFTRTMSGNVNIINQNIQNSGAVDYTQYINFEQKIRVRHNTNTYCYSYSNLNKPAINNDISINISKIDTTGIGLDMRFAYGASANLRVRNTTYLINDIVKSGSSYYKCIATMSEPAPVSDTTHWIEVEITDDVTEDISFDKFVKHSYNTVTHVGLNTADVVTYSGSTFYKLLDNNDSYITEKYLYADDDYVYLPTNGALSPSIDDTSRILTNRDCLSLSMDFASYTPFVRNICRLSDVRTVSKLPIKSKDIVSYKRDAVTDAEFLSFTYIGGNAGTNSDRYIIQKIHANNSTWAIDDGYIKPGDLIRLHAYEYSMFIPTENIANPYGITIYITPAIYPDTPAGWTRGDDWPDSFPTNPPLIPVGNSYRVWAPGDALPVGPINIFGIVGIQRKIIPLLYDDNLTMYSVDNELWTTELSDTSFLELDEEINLDTNNYPIFTKNVPDKHLLLDNHYFAFDNLLEISSITENKKLYLPKLNEIMLDDKITNIHSLSNTEVGVFTQNAIFYLSSTALNDGTIIYKKPIKSKISLGCRDGDDIITAPDGQSLIVPTQRGLTLMSNQDFVATTEKALSYISDNIQQNYNNLYNKEVVNSVLYMAVDTHPTYEPNIKLSNYRYWIIMYKFMDRDMYLLDTRNNSWWKMSMPYPIKFVRGGNELSALLEVEYLPTTIWPNQHYGNTSSPMGIMYKFDKEAITNEDDIVNGTCNGTIVNGIGEYASSKISTVIASQKLYFGLLNNYKAIQGISINSTSSPNEFTLVLNAFRNNSDMTEYVNMDIAVDTNTFVKRLNISHCICFKYRIEHDSEDVLKLNNISIKYGVKEEIR